MFINKTVEGYNNISGANIAAYRKEMGLSQKKLADKLQLAGLDIDKNAIQRIEARLRFVTDIELLYFSVVLEKPIEQLLKNNKNRL
jgi:transcriptional regulator with XRE-family HTH domain